MDGWLGIESAAGFVDIKTYVYKVPWRNWPKSRKFKYMGAVCAETATTELEAYALMTMTRLLGMSEEETRKICTECVNTIMAGKQHGYHFYWQIIGRKPDAVDSSQ